MIKCALRYTVLLLSFPMASMAQAIDLVEFGKNCLVDEARLNAEKNRLDNYKQEQDLAAVQKNQILNSLKKYKDERAELETSITDCHGNPNSAYCHKIRNRYNQLSYLEDKAQSNADKLSLNELSINNDHEYDKAVYQQERRRFASVCRDSNAHYALINDTKAYEKVCSSEKNQQTVTCSFF